MIHRRYQNGAINICTKGVLLTYANKVSRSPPEYIVNTYGSRRMYCPGYAGMKRNDRPDRLAESNPHKWLASRKILSVEKLETLPAGTKPRT